MNRRDYEAHAAWVDSVREDRAARVMHANRNAARPPMPKPRRTPVRWRAMLAAMLAK